jgi:hypothetical protein
MRVALAAGAAALPTSQSAREAATAAVAEAVLDKYSAIVLRPAQTEPALRVAVRNQQSNSGAAHVLTRRCCSHPIVAPPLEQFERASASARRDVLQSVGLLHARSLPLLEKHTTHLDAADHHDARVAIDWRFARGDAATQRSNARCVCVGRVVLCPLTAARFDSRARVCTVP